MLMHIKTFFSSCVRAAYLAHMDVRVLALTAPRLVAAALFYIL